MFRRIKKLHNFFKRLIRYIPVIWRDGDHDFMFCLTLLKHKLESMRKHITRHDIHVDAKKTGTQIIYAEELLRMIIDNDYCRDEWDEHEEKWGETVMIDNPAEDGLVAIEITTLKAQEEGRQKQERREHIAIYEKEKEREEQIYDELFDHLRENIRRWWC